MAQAHYLLSAMRKRNGGLTTHMPDETALDPNGVNATRLQILRTMLGIEAQFNQNVGVKNQAALREQQFKLQQRDDARTQLVEKENELALLEKRLAGKKREAADLKAQDARDEEERTATAKRNKKDNNGEEIKPPLTDAQQTTKQQIAELDGKIAEMETKKTSLTSEIGTLRTQSTAAVEAPTLTDAPLNATTAAQLQTPNNLDKFVTQALDNMKGKPSVAASIALDNFIGMQYEIIAKQMTLLRDEIGPDERIVFLELPSSIYTVPGKADDYMVQVEWEANWYCDVKEKDDAMISGENRYSRDQQGQRITFAEIERRWLNDRLGLTEEEQRKVIFGLLGKKEGDDNSEAFAEIQKHDSTGLDVRWKPVDLTPDLKGFLQGKLSEAHAITAPSDKSTSGSSSKQNTNPNAGGKRMQVRALDVIPRQSALNINDYHATSNNLNFLGVMKLLIGLGIKVDYQRQKDLYEQFLQQEVFASGYGKGDQKFGWTFGPMPGSHRVIPGLKTTYAVLAVPRNTAAIELTARSRAFPRCTSPESTSAPIIEETVFLVSVPGEYTDNFYVDNIAYTPVKKGEPVTAIIKGDYFSPQLGVLINGVPLTRALAVTSNENQSSECNFLAGKISGCYEQVSSREMVLNFSMGNPAYTGTPTVTLVSPEKSSAVNFFPLEINYRGRGQLFKYSEKEPMFIEELTLDAKLSDIGKAVVPEGEVKDDNDNRSLSQYRKALLTGRGMRPSARISIANKVIKNKENVIEENHRAYVDEQVKAYKENSDNHVATLADAEDRLKQQLAGDYARRILDQRDADLVAQIAKAEKVDQKKADRLKTDLEAFRGRRHVEQLEEERLYSPALKDRDGFFKALRQREIYLKADEKVKEGKSLNKARKEATEEFDGKVNLRNDQEYVEQLSTNAYLLYFKQPGAASWKLHFEHNTRQGIEEKEIDVSYDPIVDFTIQRYVPPSPAAPVSRRGRPAEETRATVKIKFVSLNPKDYPVTDVTIKPDDGEAVASTRIQDNGVYEREFRVNLDNRQERDTIHVTITTTHLATKTNVSIPLPLRPVIESIENPRITGARVDKAQGFIDEEPQVVIRGRNLQKVAKVYFGDQAVNPIGNNESTTLVVKVPKIDHIKYADNDGVDSSKSRYRLLKKQVPVKVETSQNFEPTKVSGALFFTYLEKSVTENSTSPGYVGRHK